MQINRVLKDCIISIIRQITAFCWLLVVGCWLLVVGCWLLVVGCWLLVVGDMDPNWVERQLSQKFSSWKKKGEKRERLYSYKKIGNQPFTQREEIKLEDNMSESLPKTTLSITDGGTGVEFFLPFLPAFPESEESVPYIISEKIAHRLVEERLRDRIRKELKEGSGVFLENNFKWIQITKDRRFSSLFITSLHSISQL